jgi:hypothetical protein
MPTPLAKLNLIAEHLLQRMVGLSNTMPATKHAALTALANEYGFQIVTDSTLHDDRICFNPTTIHQQDLFARLLRNEFSLYSKDVIRACGLQRVILCQDLTGSERRLAGLAELGLWLIGSLVLDADLLQRHDDFAREVFHHELFHAIDYRDDLSHYVDTDWSHLNAAGFRYNADLAFRDMPPFDDRDIAATEAGFLNTYSTQNPYEDKAVIYSNLVVRHSETVAKAAGDEILARKIGYMKSLLKSFDPSFDDAFWAKVSG